MTKIYIVITALTLFFFLNSGFSQTTYTTIANGVYDGGTCAANWDTNGCPPNPINATDVVIVNHAITFNSDLDINGILTINTGATFSGSNDIDIGVGGTLVNDGTLDTDKDLHVGGSFFNNGITNIKKLYSAGYICNTGSITIEAGQEFHNNGGVVECGGVINVCKVDSDGVGASISDQDFCCNEGGSDGPTTWDVGSTVNYDEIYFCGTWLPIELSSFNLKNGEKSILLNWETKSELNNDYFIILRSENGINFDEIGEVSGMGNSSSTVNYQFSDDRPLIGTAYYKLQQVDFDGEISFSQVLRTNFTLRNTFSLYPNPTNSDINLLLSVDVNTTIYIEVFDVLGKLVLVKNQVVLKGTNSVPLDTEMFNEGIYFCKVTFPNGNLMKQRFMKID